MFPILYDKDDVSTLANYSYEGTGGDNRAYLPVSVEVGKTYRIVFNLVDITARTGVLIRTCTGQPGTIKETIGGGYFKPPGRYEFIFTATQPANYFYIFCGVQANTHLEYFCNIYDANVEINNNGYGVLSDCTSCIISETLNGEYSLTMTYPLGGLHSENIERGKLLYAKRNNKGEKQLFRISEIKTNMLAHTMEIYAPHISYDLQNYPIPAIEKPATAYDWITYLQSFDYYDVTNPFTFTGDITAADTTSAERMERINRTVRGVLLTDNDAIINTYYPTIEFEFDNYEVKFLKARGSHTGLEVRYGKNLLTLESDDSREQTFYGCIPYYRYDQNETPVYIYASANKSGVGFDDTDPTKRAITPADFSEELNQELGISGEPTVEQRAAIATELVNKGVEWNRQTLAKNLVRNARGATITFSYIDMENTGLYYWNGPKPADVRADIGDYITLYFGDIVRETEIVGIEYNVLKERYDNITVGQVRATLSKTIKQIAEGVKQWQ